MGIEANSTCTGLILEKDRWRPPSQNRSFPVPEVGRVAQPDRAQPSKLRLQVRALPRSPAKKNPAWQSKQGSKLTARLKSLRWICCAPRFTETSFRADMIRRRVTMKTQIPASGG